MGAEAQKEAWNGRAVNETNAGRIAAGQPRLTSREELQLRREYRRLRDRGYTHTRAKSEAVASLGQTAPASTPPASTPPPAPTPPPASTPASTPPPASTPASTGSMGATAVPDPDPDDDDPIARRLAETVQLVQPTWSNDGKHLTVWMDGAEKLKLKIHPKPGPFTPSGIPDILGQPKLLYTVALGIHMTQELGQSRHVLIEGPSETAKSTAIQWICQQLNYNYFAVPMHKDLAAEDLVGEHLPTGDHAGSLVLKWIYGMVSKPILASADHPTAMAFEEFNRGRVQILTRLYSLLDGTRVLEIPNKEDEEPGVSEVLRPGELYVFATQNPAEQDDTDATAVDFIGNEPLDTALRRRFMYQVQTGYPPEEIEAETLRRRVKGLKLQEAQRIVFIANKIRHAHDVRFAPGFTTLMAWAELLPYLSFEAAAEIAMVSKASPDCRPGIEKYLELEPNGATP